MESVRRVITYNATADGQPVAGRSLALDPFSSENAMILHYLLNKNDIIKLAEERNDNNNTNLQHNNNATYNLISFTLAPNILNRTQSTSSDLVTDTGGIHAIVSWTPPMLAANKESNITIVFSDAFTGTYLNANVKYDLIILDQNGKEVVKKENIIAKNATDSETVPFLLTKPIKFNYISKN